MRRLLLMLTLACVMLAGDWKLSAQSEEVDRVRKSTTAFDEIMAVPDKAIPSAILEKAEGIAVFPGTIKAGLGIGGHRGKGILSTRHRQAAIWSNPGFLTLTGGSFGAQIGAEQIDLVLVVMNKAGIDNLLRNEFKVGGDASVAAGPVGRGAEASTDIQMKAEILSYSRARGLFAGVSLVGSAIREDEDANQRFYGRPLRNRDIVLAAKTVVGTSGNQAATEAVDMWHSVLAKYTK
jgi:lipid-binding SYLF domain-containing protein